MKRNEILLSGGSIPWQNLKNSLHYAKDIGYDGIEIVPLRNIVTEIKNIIDKYDKNNLPEYIKKLNLIKGVHQNWRLDIGFDKSYGIKFPVTLFFTILRFIFFPKIEKSNESIKFLSKYLNLPVTVHHLSNGWTKDNNNEEFPGGIFYEMIGTSITPNKLRKWMVKKNHNIVVDLRDDQSLLWAKKYGLNDWQRLWTWIGIKKIKGIQLTLIGRKGINKILNRQKNLAEDQLLWLNKNKWEGNITVEVNPISLFLSNKFDVKGGLKKISQFIDATLRSGKKWSI